MGRALAPPQWTRRARLIRSLALGAVACAAALAVWFSRPAIGPALVRDEPTAVADVSGSLVDGVLIVSIPGDGIVIAGPDRRDERPADGYGIVMVEGEGR